MWSHRKQEKNKISWVCCHEIHLAGDLLAVSWLCRATEQPICRKSCSDTISEAQVWAVRKGIAIFLAVWASSLAQAEGLSSPPRWWPRELRCHQPRTGPAPSSRHLSGSHLAKGSSHCHAAALEQAEKGASPLLLKRNKTKQNKTNKHRTKKSNSFSHTKGSGWDYAIYTCNGPLHRTNNLKRLLWKACIPCETSQKQTDIWYNFLQILRFSLLYNLPKYLQPSAFDWKPAIGLPSIIFNSLNR